MPRGWLTVFNAFLSRIKFFVLFSLVASQLMMFLLRKQKIAITQKALKIHVNPFLNFAYLLR